MDEINSVDAIVVSTNWAEYKKALIGKVLLDARRLFKPTDFPETVYLTIGKTI